MAHRAGVCYERNDRETDSTAAPREGARTVRPPGFRGPASVYAGEKRTERTIGEVVKDRRARTRNVDKPFLFSLFFCFFFFFLMTGSMERTLVLSLFSVHSARVCLFFVRGAIHVFTRIMFQTASRYRVTSSNHESCLWILFRLFPLFLRFLFVSLVNATLPGSSASCGYL